MPGTITNHIYMELSILVAKILAVTYLAAGVGALTGEIKFNNMIEDFKKSSGLTFMSGFVALIAGMLLVHYHNIWESSWVVLVTIVGWLAVAKGVVLMAFPHSMMFFAGMYKNSKMYGAVMVILGLVFGYFGFYM